MARACRRAVAPVGRGGVRGRGRGWLPFTARGAVDTPDGAFYRKGRLVDECVRARPTQVSDRTWLHAVEDPDEAAGWR